MPTILLDVLKQLQAIDAELYRLRQDQQRKPLELERAKQALAEEEARAKTGEAQVHGLQVKQKEQEMELSTREATIKKLQGQLFQVKTNKEYSALQQEIEQAKADISLIEEEILKILEAIDHAKQVHQGQAGQVAKQQQQVHEEDARVQEELGVMRQRSETLEAQRKLLTPQVERASLSLYERVLAGREGLALVPLVEQSCGGCHMVQPPQVISEVHLNAKLVTCDSCNRILYRDDG
jgi:predicted  nucleic acid-binding Zn-ribbon protein